MYVTTMSELSNRPLVPLQDGVTLRDVFKRRVYGVVVKVSVGFSVGIWQNKRGRYAV